MSHNLVFKIEGAADFLGSKLCLHSAGALRVGLGTAGRHLKGCAIAGLLSASQLEIPLRSEPPYSWKELERLQSDSDFSVNFLLPW